MTINIQNNYNLDDLEKELDLMKSDFEQYILNKIDNKEKIDTEYLQKIVNNKNAKIIETEPNYDKKYEIRKVLCSIKNRLFIFEVLYDFLNDWSDDSIIEFYEVEHKIYSKFVIIDEYIKIEKE